MADTFAALTTLAIGERSFLMARLDAVASKWTSRGCRTR